MSDSLTLHHLEYSQSFRILWILEELGIEYQLRSYERDAKTLGAPEEYKRLSPLGTAPVITHGDLVLAESSAIIDHLLDLYPRASLRPQVGTPDRVRYLFWFHSAQGSLMPLQLMWSVFKTSVEKFPFFLKPFIKIYISALNNFFIGPKLDRLLEKAETDLVEAPWFGGKNVTAADFLISYNLIVGAECGLVNKNHPRCLEWIARMKALPSFKEAQRKDGRACLSAVK